MTSQTLLSLHGIHLQFHGRDVLKHIDLEIHAGEIVTLVGPNGAGKSSLARIALGLLSPQKGQRRQKDGLVIGYMPQKLHLDDSLPLTVDRFLWLAGRSSKSQRRAVLQQVGASHLQQHPVQRLSGGETQRILLARALLRQPQLLVLDEPAQGVDVAGQDALYGLLSQVRRETGCAILLISHDLHWVMASSDRVVCLQGHVCCEGTPDNIWNSPDFTRLFGESASRIANLAPYSHHHDHHHDLHGDKTADDDDNSGVSHLA